MTPFNAAAFMRMHHIVSGFYQNFVDFPESKVTLWPLEATIKRKDREDFRSIFRYHELVCDQLGLAASASTLRKIYSCLENKSSTYKDYFSLGPELGDRLVDEMEQRHFIALSNAEARHYMEPLTGWEEALDRIPNLTSDIDEGSRCFALGRYTAAVFHMMRVMELAVQSLCKKLGIENVERVWGVLLSDIGQAIKQLPDQGERKKWSEAHTLLYHVKQAWRNEVMHPKQTYTEEEASEVISATKSFIRHLARLV